MLQPTILDFLKPPLEKQYCRNIHYMHCHSDDFRMTTTSCYACKWEFQRMIVHWHRNGFRFPMEDTIPYYYLGRDSFQYNMQKPDNSYKSLYHQLSSPDYKQALSFPVRLNRRCLTVLYSASELAQTRRELLKGSRA